MDDTRLFAVWQTRLGGIYTRQGGQVPLAKSVWEALRRPSYDLFGNNCENFARYVATGKRESTQVQAVGILA